MDITEQYAIIGWSIEDVKHACNSSAYELNTPTDSEMKSLLKENEDAICDVMTQAGWDMLDCLIRRQFGK